MKFNSERLGFKSLEILPVRVAPVLVMANDIFEKNKISPQRSVAISGINRTGIDLSDEATIARTLLGYLKDLETAIDQDKKDAFFKENLLFWPLWEKASEIEKARLPQNTSPE